MHAVYRCLQICSHNDYPPKYENTTVEGLWMSGFFPSESSKLFKRNIPSTYGENIFS